MFILHIIKSKFSLHTAIPIVPAYESISPMSHMLYGLFNSIRINESEIEEIRSIFLYIIFESIANILIMHALVTDGVNPIRNIKNIKKSIVIKYFVFLPTFTLSKKKNINIII